MKRGDGCHNVVRVKVASGWDVIEPDNVTVPQKTNFAIRIISRFVPSRKNGPLVVVIFIVITGDLLLG